jgi:hypothetical protein
LAYIRTAGASVFGLAASAAIDLSLSGNPHKTVTYVIAYGIAFVGLVVAIGTTVIIDRRSGVYDHSRAGTPPKAEVTDSDGSAEKEVSHKEESAKPATPAPRSAKKHPHPSESAPDSISPTTRPNSPLPALEKLYSEGHRMLKASSLLTAVVSSSLFYGPRPTEADIDRWQGKVRAALPKQHRRRFQFAPLQRQAQRPLGNLGLASLETQQERRLKESLSELERIMVDLGQPA